MRIIRRPYEWFRRPWPDDRVVRLAVTVSTLVVTTFIMMRVVHFRPILGDDLIFDDVTPTGGDMGSHVWAPAYLRDHLLPNFQLSGWSMDWYGGLPVYRFYMVVPALAMVLLDTVLPYGVAFKLVAISGLVSLPFTCWAFGRLARFRYPMPELFAFAGLCFALNESTTIYGGNVLATMAGEFSFSIAISLMMLGLGLLARGLDDGKGRLMMWASIVLALACLSHGIVLIYTAVGALVIVACRSRRRPLAAARQPDQPAPGRRRWRPGSRLHRAGRRRPSSASSCCSRRPSMLPLGADRRRLPARGSSRPSSCASAAGWSWLPNQLFVKRLLYGASIGGLTLLLAAFWVGPFLFNHDYMTDMKYGFKPDGGSESFWSMLFDQEPFLDVLINTLAIIGLIAAIARRHVYGVALGLTGLIAVALVYLTRDSLPVIGLLWNPRVLPWVYLMRYLMMMVGAVEVAGVLVNWLRNRPAREVPGVGHAVADRRRHRPRRARRLRLRLPDAARAAARSATSTPGGRSAPMHGMPDARSDGWPAYNFRGYESKPLYPEYHDLVQTMDDLGARDDGAGCGRALWEIDNRDGVGNGKYGTTMALMLLPFWTDGCIAVDGGPLLRGVGHDAVPLPHRRGDVRPGVQPGAPAALHRQRRRRRHPAHPRPRDPLRDGHDRRGDRRGGDPPGADPGRRERAVAHLRVRRRGHRRAARRPAGRRQRPRRRPARVLPGDRHVVVPAPGRVGGDAGGRRARDLAAHRRRHRRESPGAPRPGHRRVRRPAVVHVAAGEHRPAGAGHRRRRPPRGRGHATSRSASSPSSSTSPSPACPCSCGSATSRTGPPTGPRVRTASAPTRWLSSPPTPTSGWRSSAPTPTCSSTG